MGWHNNLPALGFVAVVVVGIAVGPVAAVDLLSQQKKIVPVAAVVAGTVVEIVGRLRLQRPVTKGLIKLKQLILISSDFL